METQLSCQQRGLRERRIARVTIAGSAINVLLVIVKFAAGIIGHSAAILADAVHSCSDFMTDVVVLVFVKVGARPQDDSHDYGHGKFETLATLIIGVALLSVAIFIAIGGVEKVVTVVRGGRLMQPSVIAFYVAVASIVLKEWAYQFTVRVAKSVKSQTLEANAWHHRSDALSSIGTAVGIGGAIFLGPGWAILDPIAAVVVSVFILKVALTLMKQSIDELTERSLPEEVEREIVRIAESEPGVSEVHNLCTRRIGNAIAIEMHLRLPAGMTVYDAHVHATNIEVHLRRRFGEHTHLGLHVEPYK